MAGGQLGQLQQMQQLQQLQRLQQLQQMQQLQRLQQLQGQGQGEIRRCISASFKVKAHNFRKIEIS